MRYFISVLCWVFKIRILPRVALAALGARAPGAGPEPPREHTVSPGQLRTAGDSSDARPLGLQVQGLSSRWYAEVQVHTAGSWRSWNTVPSSLLALPLGKPLSSAAEGSRGGRERGGREREGGERSGKGGRVEEVGRGKGREEEGGGRGESACPLTPDCVALSCRSKELVIGRLPRAGCPPSWT